MTNLGSFRADLLSYLEHHPEIHEHHVARCLQHAPFSEHIVATAWGQVTLRSETHVGPEGYDPGPMVHSGTRHRVWRGRRANDGLDVVLKAPTQPRAEDGDRLRREYRFGTCFHHPGIVRILSLEESEDGPCLVMEDNGGVSLDRWLTTNTPSETEAVTLAIGMAEGLAAMHEAGVLHLDFHPGNVIVCNGDLTTRIIDFSHAVHVDELPGADPPAGVLKYASPERSGRQHRGVDHRSDLYSLGCILFELLSGQPPFTSDDPLELVHAHLAKKPPDLFEAGKASPLLAAVVNCLLEKNADDRYRSASAAIADLRRVQVGESSSSQSVVRPMAARSVLARLRRPGHLGRSSELEQLREAVERAELGRQGIGLVKGPAGVGKTRLINELCRPLLEGEGVVLRGTSDQVRQGFPRAVMTEVFQDLARQLLSLPQEELDHWREQLLSSLDTGAGVMTQLVPELEPVLGALRRTSHSPTGRVTESTRGGAATVPAHTRSGSAATGGGHR